MKALATAMLLLALAAPALAAPVPACGGSSTIDDYAGKSVAGVDYARRVRIFLGEVQRAVGADDRAALAKMIRYPVRWNSGKRRMTLGTAARFLKAYPAIATPAWKAAILAQTPQCLFANWQGAMIGDGEIWFDDAGGKMAIVAINAP